MNNEAAERTERNTTIRGAIGRRISQNSTREIQERSGLGDIRSYTEGLPDEQRRDREIGERESWEKESERLIDIAKHNGQFFLSGQYGNFGERVSKRTGECMVYKKGDVYTKVKDPCAKQPIKGTRAEDAIYEHVIHNLLFPNVPYTFQGISEDLGYMRIVLSQVAVTSFRRPSEQQIGDYLETKLGLKREDAYSWGNEAYSITDVGENSDNVLLGVDGQLYFIDPLIKLKESARTIIENIVKHNSPS